MADTAVGIAFQGKDQVSPVVRGIRSTMDRFKRDAAAGFGLGAGISVFNLATRAIGGVVDVMGDAVRLAMEEEAGIAQLTRSIEENSEGWDGNIDRIEEVISAREKLAFSDGEQRESLRALVAVTKDIDEAMRLQAIAMDLARLRGMELAAATELIGKVSAGNLGILSRYGIVLEKGTTATEALAEIQRRATGQAEAFANTTQGKMVQASIALENAMESLGMALLPVVGQLSEIAADVIPEIVKGVGDLVDEVRRFDPAFDRIVRVNDAIDELAETMNLSSSQADQLRTKWTALARESELVTGTQEELTTAILDQEGAWIMAAQAAQAARFTFSRGAKATTEATVDVEAFNEALRSLADGGLAEARKETRSTQRAIRDLLRGGDEQKSVRKLRQELRLLARQKRQAANRERPEAFAAITARQEVIRTLLRERGVVIEGMRQWREANRKQRTESNQTKTAVDRVTGAVEGTGDALNALPDKTTVKVDVIGEEQVRAAVAQISNLVAMSGNVVSVYLQGLGFGRRAAGGPVESGRSYLVGERGPEILTMGRGSGHITPNHATGGGNVYLDGHWVGRLMDERMGRRYGMTAMPGSYRS